MNTLSSRDQVSSKKFASCQQSPPVLYQFTLVHNSQLVQSSVHTDENELVHVHSNFFKIVNNFTLIFFRFFNGMVMIKIQSYDHVFSN